MEYKGCYSLPAGVTYQGFIDQGSYSFQSLGYCQGLCVPQGLPVMALWKGSDCLCGNAMPPNSIQIDDFDCNIPCDGWPQDTCMFLQWKFVGFNVNMIHLGGSDTSYNIYLTNTTRFSSTLPVLSLLSASSTFSRNSTAATPTVTNSVYVTATPTITNSVTASSRTDHSSQNNKSSGPNIAGIASGVVVGVVVLSITIGFLIRGRMRLLATTTKPIELPCGE